MEKIGFNTFALDKKSKKKKKENSSTVLPQPTEEKENTIVDLQEEPIHQELWIKKRLDKLLKVFNKSTNAKQQIEVATEIIQLQNSIIYERDRDILNALIEDANKLGLILTQKGE